MRVPPEKPTVECQQPLPAPENGEPSRSKEDERARLEMEELVERLGAKVDAQAAEMLQLRESREKYVTAYRAGKQRIAELEQQMETVSNVHKQALAMQNQRIRAMEDELAETRELAVARVDREIEKVSDAAKERIAELEHEVGKAFRLHREILELLAAKSKESPGSQSPVSTANQLLEAEILGVVRNLNENIFQVAANLTEEWEKFRASRSSKFSITDEEIDTFSQSYGSSLVHQVLGRNPTAVTFLVQSCLCDLTTQVTSSWRHNDELRLLRSVYQLLSPSSEGKAGGAILARWKSLTQNHLSATPSHSVSIMQRVADVLWITGTFPTTRHSFDFVQAKASHWMETIDRLVLRLESMFAMDVTSSDMCLLFETPGIAFDDTRMTKEFESIRASASESQDKVVGTTEVGIRKCEGQGEDQRTMVLLKAKVVLEKDMVDI